MEKPHIPPTLALIIAVTAVSFSAIFIRLCSAPPFVIGFYRLFFTCCLIIPYTLYQNKIHPSPLQWNEIKFSILSGLFLGVHFAFWITSVSMTSVASASILVATQPLFVSFLGWIILHEPLDRRNILALFIAFLGTAIISHGDFQLGKKELMGDFFALIAGALAGAYFLTGRKIRKTVNLTNYISIVYSTGCILLGIMALFMRNSFIHLPTSTFFWMFMLALVPTVIGHSLYNWSLRYLTAHKVGMTIFGEPLIATILAFFIFSESPPFSTYIGGIFIMIGLYLVFSSPKIKPRISEVID